MSQSIVFAPNSIGAMLGSGRWYVLCLAALLLMLAEIGFFVRTISRTRQLWDRVLVVFALLTGFLLFSLLAYGFYYMNTDIVWNTNLFVTQLYQQPFALYAALEAALCALAVLIMRTGYLRQKERISHRAVMETVNRLGAGLCICQPDGTVLLVNTRMNELCRRFTGEGLSHGARLLSALREKGTQQEDETTLLATLPEGETWLFSERKIQTGAGALLQIIASDMTEPKRIADQLEEENKHLGEVQEKLRSVSKAEREMVALRESSRAKTTVHNQMGNVLLVGKYYMEHPEETDEQELLQLLSYNNENLIRVSDQGREKKDPLEEACEVAERIGLTVSRTGDEPKEPRLREVLGEAVRQCGANAVRHAGADALMVSVRHLFDGWQFEITNSGKPPKGPIEEGGGLGALRKKVEEFGGSMKILAHPAFCLQITLPEKQPQV